MLPGRQCSLETSDCRGLRAHPEGDIRLCQTRSPARLQQRIEQFTLLALDTGNLIPDTATFHQRRDKLVMRFHV
jgi:hypothetical protein